MNVVHKISIVIPVYNVEKYIKACLDSIYSQITPQCQVILVDDGSTDNSGKICDEYAAKYDDTTVIHQENAGQGSARNNGVAVADGEYLFFIDSDDFIEPGAIATALTDIEHFGTDMIIYPMKVVSETGALISVDRDPFEVGKIYSPADEKGLICVFPAPWNKLIKTSVFKDNCVAFPSKVWYEDLRTTPKLVSMSKSVVFSDTPLYNYLRREGSTMNNSKVERNIEIIAALDDIISWFKANGKYDLYREEIDFLVIDHVLLTASVRVIRSSGTKHHLIGKFRDYAFKNCDNLKNNKYIAAMPKNRRTVLKLLLAKHYLAVALIFKIKG